jgi:DNA-directed RNA polymerase subunit alpha
LEVSLPRIECTTSSDSYARFEIGPLEQGYGVTLGNALRRILISSLPGAAVTAVHIEGIRHEFSDIDGVKEDVTELVLNLKKIRMRCFSDEPVHLILEARGEGDVAAGDIRATDLVEIVNPDQHLATLDGARSSLEVEVVVEKGVGYNDISDQREEAPIGRIPVDGIFSPIERVNFRVEPRRVGQMTNFDELILEVWTDGTIHPNDALTTAASILTQHFQHLSTFGQEPAAIQGKQPSAARALPTQEAETPIEELQLSARAENSLKRAGITKVGQIVTMNPEDLLSIRNFGQKSFNELVERLRLRKLVPDDYASGLTDAANGGE